MLGVRALWTGVPWTGVVGPSSLPVALKSISHFHCIIIRDLISLHVPSGFDERLGSNESPGALVIALVRGRSRSRAREGGVRAWHKQQLLP